MRNCPRYELFRTRLVSCTDDRRPRHRTAQQCRFDAGQVKIGISSSRRRGAVGGLDATTNTLTGSPGTGYLLASFFLLGQRYMTAISERHFQVGLGLLAQGRYADAAVRFQAAIVSEKEGQVLRPQMRYRSYYGLSRALSRGAKLEDVKLCEMAAEADHFDPVLQLNLGRVYLRAGKTTRALRTFRRGLQLEPNNPELLTALLRADRRQKPVIPALSRDHSFNRSLGRLRARFLVRG